LYWKRANWKESLRPASNDVSKDVPNDVPNDSALAGQPAQEFLLVHAVLESFTAINEDDWNLVAELAAKFGVGVNVDLLPGESSAP
jgi:hypothetical protein